MIELLWVPNLQELYVELLQQYNVSFGFLDYSRTFLFTILSYRQVLIIIWFNFFIQRLFHTHWYTHTWLLHITYINGVVLIRFVEILEIFTLIISYFHMGTFKVDHCKKVCLLIFRETLSSSWTVSGKMNLTRSIYFLSDLSDSLYWTIVVKCLICS